VAGRTVRVLAGGALATDRWTILIFTHHLDVEHRTLDQAQDGLAAFERLDLGHQDVVLEIDRRQSLAQPKLGAANSFELLFLPGVAG
jgi:hypothetical protein